jgi:hypothetical protein
MKQIDNQSKVTNYTRYINPTTCIYFNYNEKDEIVDHGVKVNGEEQEIDMLYRVIGSKDIENLKHPIEMERMKIPDVFKISFTFLPSKFGNVLDYCISPISREKKMKIFESFQDSNGNLGKSGLSSALEIFKSIQSKEIALFEMIDEYLKSKAADEVC